MAGREKPGNEILLEQLTKRVTELTQERKSLESAIKELKEQVYITEKESLESITATRTLTEKKIAEIKEAVKPLQALQDSCHAIRQEIAKLKQEKIDAASEIKEARSAEIKAANAAVILAEARLGKLERAIADCKERAAAL